MLSKNSIRFVVKIETPTAMSQRMTHSSKKVHFFIFICPSLFASSQTRISFAFCSTFIRSFYPFFLFHFASICFASRNNSVTQADYTRSPKSPSIGPPNVPFKPVPPPKPKNYRPPMQGGQMHSGNWENGVSVGRKFFFFFWQKINIFRRFSSRKRPHHVHRMDFSIHQHHRIIIIRIHKVLRHLPIQ